MDSAEQLAARIRRRWPRTAQVGIVLGSGLGDLAEEIATELVVPYAELDLPVSTAAGHRGQFVCGTLAGASVIAMQGRCHVYEGYRGEQLAQPIRILHTLGAGLLVASNASGGLNPHYRSGEIMAITGHLNLMGPRAIPTGIVPGGGAWRRSSSPYDPHWIHRAQEIARHHDFPCHRGVYAAVCGPNYETRAECRFLRRFADVVGMSTVPEVLTAAACGMRVLALSTITNVIRPDAPHHVDHQDVLHTAALAGPRLRQILRGVLEEVAKS